MKNQNFYSIKVSKKVYFSQKIINCNKTGKGLRILFYILISGIHRNISKKINAKYFCIYLKFGDSQKLRLVRILQSTVMVRVGGGWMALDEFLVKNDPCRGK